jgi:hypothetical protein
MVVLMTKTADQSTPDPDEVREELQSAIQRLRAKFAAGEEAAPPASEPIEGDPES